MSQISSSLATWASLERRRGVAEHRARVAHRPVEHPREQLVAEVVVGGDVAAGGGRGCCASRCARIALDRDADGGDQSAQAVEAGRVPRRQANERGEVGRIPQPWAYASARPRLPVSAIRHIRGERTWIVAAGGPEPYTRRSPASITVSVPVADPPQEQRQQPISRSGRSRRARFRMAVHAGAGELQARPRGRRSARARGRSRTGSARRGAPPSAA